MDVKEKKLRLMHAINRLRRYYEERPPSIRLKNILEDLEAIYADDEWVIETNVPFAVPPAKERNS